LDPAHPKTLRFGQVAMALGMMGNASPLRNWLRRGQVKIQGGYGDGWADFTFRDLIALALIQELVEYNVGVERAGQLVEQALSAVWRPEYEVSPKLTTPRSDGVVDPRAPPPLPARLYMFTDDEGKEQIKWAPAGHIVDANSWVIIDVHRTISSAITVGLELLEPLADADEMRTKIVERIDALADQRERILREEAKHAAMQTLQASLRKAGVAIAFTPDGTVKVLARKPKAAPRKRRTRKATKR